jgi:4-carboxymuconolactone decarboxylase
MKYGLTAIISSVVFLTAANTASFAQERFLPIPDAQMTPEQKKVADALKSGPRGEVVGPFNAWLRSPEVASRMADLGSYIRYKSSLPARLNEFAILVTAREWTSQFEWYSHYPLAIKGGLNPQIAADVAAGKRPTGMQPDEEIVYDFSIQMHRNKGNVSDALFKKAIDKLGEQGVIDLLAVNGYYSAVSMTLNFARVPLPAGVPVPLAPLK